MAGGIVAHERDFDEGRDLADLPHRSADELVALVRREGREALFRVQHAILGDTHNDVDFRAFARDVLADLVLLVVA